MLHPLDASAEPTTNWQRPRDSNFEAVETEADLTMSCLIFFPMYFQQLSMFFSEIQKSNLGIFSFLKFFRCRAQSYRYLSMRRYDRSSAAQKIRICILGGGGVQRASYGRLIFTSKSRRRNSKAAQLNAAAMFQRKCISLLPNEIGANERN
jgi:hypothetical protein